MKRLLLLVLLFIPTAAFPDFIRYYPPATAGGATWDGGDFSAAATGPTGCVTPAYSFTADSNAGMCLSAANNIEIGPNTNGSTSVGYLSANTTLAGMTYFNAASAPTALSCRDGDCRFTATGGATYFSFTTTGALIGDVATHDRLSIAPVALGGGSFTGTFTSADLTAARTWTHPDATGDVAVIASTGFPVRTGAQAWSTRCLAAGTGVTIAEACGQAGNITVGVDSTVVPLKASGTGLPPSGSCDEASEVGNIYSETDAVRTCICGSTGGWICSSQARSHATDCTGLTDGLANDVCLELDSERFFSCQPSAGGCDTAGEWIQTPAAGGSFDGNVTAQFSLQADVTPSQVTATQNDYSGCDSATTTVCRLSTDANRAFTGFDEGSDGRLLVLRNVGAQLLTLSDESTGSTAANRIAIAGTGDLYIGPGGSINLIYDATLSRWVPQLSLASSSPSYVVGTTSASASIQMVANVSHGAQMVFSDTNTNTLGEVTGWGNSAGGTSAGYARARMMVIQSNSDSFGLITGSSGADPVIVASNDETRYYVEDSPKTITETVATSFARVALASGEMTGGNINYTVEASDATDHQALSGTLRFAIVNKAATETCPDPTDTGTVLLAASASTLTCSWTCDETPANAVDFQANCTSGLTQTVLRINWSIEMQGAAGIVTPQ